MFVIKVEDGVPMLCAKTAITAITAIIGIVLPKMECVTLPQKHVCQMVENSFSRCVVRNSTLSTMKRLKFGILSR